MRQQVDLAILHLEINHHWFAPQIAVSRPALARIYLHDLDWEQSGEFAAAPNERLGVGLRSDVLYQAAVRLRRYDALLLPVSRETLAWTRKLLASIPRGPNIPLIGILHEVQAGGMIDLLELGMLDFVQTPVDQQELRARILCGISRAPLRVSLRDSISQRVRAPIEAGKPSAGSPGRSTGARNSFDGYDKSFGEAKANLIAQFERQYVRDALAMQQGNVARAAASSGKNRRAFWEIMRKHQIEAAEFRVQRDKDDNASIAHA